MPAPSLPPLTLAPTVPADVDVLVVGLADSSAGTILVGCGDGLADSYAERTGQDLLRAALSLGGRPKPGTTVVVPTASALLVVTGLGDVDVTPEQVRRAVGTGVRRAAELTEGTPLRVAVSMDTVEPGTVRGAAEGALLGAYAYPKATADPAPAAVGSLVLVAPEAARPALEAARVVATAVCQARDWVNAPANLLYPESLADLAKAAVRSARIDVEVLDEKGLTREGYGGILAVGGGSARPPRLVRYAYAPPGARSHLVLVGKGITFDSGGLDLKTAEGMYTMKCDMAGAAAVLAATKAIAELGLRLRVTAYAPMAENMPSGKAFRPSDVLTMYGGTTVENANTDAEGRLVLADALARAAKDSPDLVVDVATLTGACVVALGQQTAGLMASDDATADQVLDAAETAGEAFWHLPVTDEAVDALTSDVADLRSSGTKRHGGALTAAAFLRSFVPDGTPWAHLDIAGPAWSEEARSYAGKGATGVGVRTLVALAESLQD